MSEGLGPRRVRSPALSKCRGPRRCTPLSENRYKNHEDTKGHEGTRSLCDFVHCTRHYFKRASGELYGGVGVWERKAPPYPHTPTHPYIPTSMRSIFVVYNGLRIKHQNPAWHSRPLEAARARIPYLASRIPHLYKQIGKVLLDAP